MTKIKFICVAILSFFSTSLAISHELIHLGTDYGGWVVPKNFITQKSICYCFGAGEDISFDLELINKFGCHVYTFDPTPRAKKHIDELFQTLRDGQSYHPHGANQQYVCDAHVLKNLHFYQLALWDDNTTLEFWAPKNKSHVSHSIINLQNTTESIKVCAQKLSHIMAILKHDHIDLLKIDIEGAEYRVLANIIQENIAIGCINVEFHAISQFAPDFNNIMLALAKKNYVQTHYKKSSDSATATFVHKPSGIRNN